MTRARDIADLAGGGTLLTRQLFTATAGQTTFTPSAGYNPGALEVFMNGLMLLASDYTATNSSTVVLGVAANAGDEVEILTYQINTIGDTISASSGGTISSPITVNRNTTDGDILSFNKDGAAVGTIGTNGSTLYIGSPEGADAHLGFGNQIIRPVTSSGASRDNAIDLGYNGMRFRDAYLSGGIYLGGTVSANKLDDYEEGTFTLAWSGTGGTANSTNVMSYVKVGSRVTINGNTSSAVPNATGTLELTGLPFAANDDAVGAMLYRHMSPPSGAHNLVVYIGSGQTKLQPYWASGSAYSRLTSSQFAVSANNDIYFSITYQTNS
jgi:hypothetical protein